VADPGFDEQKAVRRVARGDAEAFESLVKTYEPRLLAFLGRLTGHPDTAMEIAQEAFLKAYFKADTFDFRCSFYTWLCEIAIRKHLDWQKKRKRWLRKHLLSDLRDQFDQQDRLPGPSERAEAKELAQTVRAAIAQLSQAHQTVLLLREFEGASYEEIAAAMNCSVGTVESRLFRARQKLRELLQPLVRKHDL
jgi:RNA polymerase sigma-70 factor (ECF subfamily)